MNNFLAFLGASLVLLNLSIANAAGGILWVGAHPDDELYVAPLFEQLCVRQGLECDILVITDGRKGPCHRPEGCLPDLKTVRKAEMEASAARFKARLTMMSLEDSPAANPTDSLLSWNNEVGGGNNLFLGVTSFIKQLSPAYVVTFDPRHGSSCHHDHRAASALAISAALTAGVAKESIYMVEQMWTDTRAWEQAVPTDVSVIHYDATSTWQAIVDLFMIHRSQFTHENILGFYLAPATTRYVKLLRYSDAQDSDMRYQNLCPIAF